MQKALQDAGLFEDEAEAVLTAWQESYFHRPGLRLFFVAPQSWTQKIMPMNISSRAEHVWSGEEARRERPPIDAEVHRAMLGQIEIVTPEQRRIAAELAGREPKAPFAFVAGPHSIEGFWCDEWQKRYDQLGRFRKALVIDEQSRRPSELLAAFMQRLRLAEPTSRRAIAKA